MSTWREVFPTERACGRSLLTEASSRRSGKRVLRMWSPWVRVFSFFHGKVLGFYHTPFYGEKVVVVLTLRGPPWVV